MGQNQNPTSNPFIGLFEQMDDNAAARPSQTDIQANQTPPMMTNVGGQWMPVDPRQLANLSVNQNADLQTLMKFMPRSNAGPYTSNGALNATGSVYRKQLASPYVNALAQTLGQRHPEMASLLDAGLLSMAGTSRAMDAARASSGGYGTTFGDALGAMAQGEQYGAEAPLARRQQLEQVPLSYEQQQAQLQESRAGYLQHLMGALNEYESNPAKILAQMGRNSLATSIGSSSRERIAGMNNQTRLETALGSDETRLAVARLQAQYRASNPQQRASLYSRFAQGLDAHIGQINNRFDKLEHAQVYDPATGLLRDRTAAEIQQLEDERQSEIGAELEYGDEVSRRAFGHNLMENVAPTQAPAASPRNRSRANTLPPAAARQLKAGQNTRFANGQVWTLRRGKPVRVR